MNNVQTPVSVQLALSFIVCLFLSPPPNSTATNSCMRPTSVRPSVRELTGRPAAERRPPNPPPCWLLMKDGVTSCLAGSLRASTESSAAPHPRLHTNSASFTGCPPVNTGCGRCCLQAAHESHVQVSARPACLLALSFFFSFLFFSLHTAAPSETLSPPTPPAESR